MTAQDKAIVAAKHGSIAAALAAAQAHMGPALKSANNPHFRTKYADLSSVMDACLPALNANGIAVIQPTTDDEHGRYVETVFIHADTGQELRCRVPLIVNKNDMQGYGSAVTYARRYGLMSMAGIAPEDDDGNAATAAPPSREEPRQPVAAPRDDTAKAKALADEMIGAVKKHGPQAVTGHANFAGDIAWLQSASAKDHARVMAALETAPADSVAEDEIPY
jgi:hypothetical protein